MKMFAHLDRKSSGGGGGQSGGGSVKRFARLDRKSSRRQPAVDTNPRRSHSGSEVVSPNDSAFGLVRETEVEPSPVQGNGNAGAKIVAAPHEGGGVGGGVARGGDEAGGGGQSGEVSRRAAASSAPYASNDGGTVSDVAVPRGVSPGGAAVGDVSGGVDGDGVAVPQNVSMQESGGTNPLYKSVAPYTLSAQGSQAVSKVEDLKCRAGLTCRVIPFVCVFSFVPRVLL